MILCVHPPVEIQPTESFLNWLKTYLETRRWLHSSLCWFEWWRHFIFLRMRFLSQVCRGTSGIESKTHSTYRLVASCSRGGKQRIITLQNSYKCSDGSKSVFQIRWILNVRFLGLRGSGLSKQWIGICRACWWELLCFEISIFLSKQNHIWYIFGNRTEINTFWSLPS